MAEYMEEYAKESLLIKIVQEDHPRSKPKPLIQKVPPILRQVKANETCFDPKVVFLGPYHCSKQIDCHCSKQIDCHCSQQIDCHKKEAVRWFFSLWPRPISDDIVMKIYKKFVIETSRDPPLRYCYAADDTAIKRLKDEDISFMMFFDGCFILYLVYLAVKNPERNHYLSQPFIVSDMFLLENQIPYAVLKSLMDLIPSPNTLTKKDIEKFIELSFLPENESCNMWSSSRGTFDRMLRAMSPSSGKREVTRKEFDNEPLHLLDILRTKLIGSDPVGTSLEYHDYYFRSIMELKAKGIKLHKSHSSNLNKIEYNMGLIYGYLSLPQMIIDDTTKTRLLNLIAYEMCPGCPSESVRVITSYICFLNSLIHHADDVKELRSKDILLNRLGSDQQVVNLFNEVATNLISDPMVYAIYSDTLFAIQSHCKSQLKVCFAEILHTHFSSPWTVIFLIAALLLLFLTIVQNT